MNIVRYKKLRTVAIASVAAVSLNALNNAFNDTDPVTLTFNGYFNGQDFHDAFESIENYEQTLTTIL